MDKGKILELKDKLNQNGVIISFTGFFSQGVIEEIGEALKMYLKSQSRAKQSIHNIFSVFIELAQNAKNYAYRFTSDERERILASGVILIGKSEEGYYITSGNLVKSEDGQALKNLLQGYNGFDKDALDKVYKEKLKEPYDATKDGAGMGLVTIAKISKNRLNYHILEEESGYSFYYLTVFID